MKINSIWDAIIFPVLLLFTILIWLPWLGLQDFNTFGAITQTIIWLIGSVVLVLGSKLVGFTTVELKKAMKVTETSIWETLVGGFVGILATIIIWFKYISTPTNFTIEMILTTAVSWIILVLILTVGSLFLGYFADEVIDNAFEKASAKIGK